MYRCYIIMSVLAISGLLVTCASIGSSEALAALRDLNANRLKEALYSDYVIGVHSLRYLGILTGPIGLYYLYLRKGPRVLHLANLLALFVAALIASRMSLLMSAFIFAGIVERRGLAIPRRHWIGLTIVCAMLLVYFNWSRNYWAYTTVWGVTNPLTMAIAETMAYLGAPFQVSIGVANNLEVLPSVSIWECLGAILPTYVENLSGPAWKDMVEAYRAWVDVEPCLTTNSAFAWLVMSGGYTAFPIMGLVSFAAAYLAGHFRGYRNQMALISYLLSYGFAELWRVYLFRAGMLHFLIFSIILSTFVASIRLTPPARRQHWAGS
jgi:hypothetical protein